MEELLIARDITKSFKTNGQQLHILNGINLTIYKGEMIAVMGASGVGKSTLLNILADEPTGNLDTHTGEEVYSLLKDINQVSGTTFVVVTHNERLATQAGRILRMVDGQISGKII